MAAKELLSFDLTIFQQSSSPMKSCSKEPGNCIVIKRILTALSYYNHLDINNNENDRSIFNNFMDTIYKHQVYDDKFHFTRFHQNEIESVSKLATSSFSCKPCDLSTCLYSDRHFRVNQTEVNDKASTNSAEDMKYFQVHTEIMDSLHFNVFHLIDGGLRDSKDNKDTIQDDEKRQSSPYFDATFSRLRDDIKNSRVKTDRFTRLGGNKYNISVVDDSMDDNDQTSLKNEEKSEKVIIEKKKRGKTFLDQLYKYLSSKASGNKSSVSKLKKLIKSHDYDTESVDMDLNIYKEYGVCNISLELNVDEDAMPAMIEYFDKSKSFDIFIHHPMIFLFIHE